jgi:ParB family chromosome partitioning protein
MARKLTLANNPLLSGPRMEDRGSASGIPYREVALELIDRDPNQPRVHFDESKLEELAASIKNYGIMNPLIVKAGKKPGRYQLVAGERRFRAASKLGLQKVPVIVNEEGRNNEDTILAMQLVENLQRDDLTPLERAHAIGALKDSHALSIREVADMLGVSKGMVQRSLEILELPDDLLNALREGASESKILLLAKIEDQDVRASYLKELETLTRKKLQKDVEDETSKADVKSLGLTPDDERVVEEMRRALGLKVKMARSAPNADSGKITIEFYSNDDLQEIFRKLVS